MRCARFAPLLLALCASSLVVPAPLRLPWHVSPRTPSSVSSCLASSLLGVHRYFRHGYCARVWRPGFLAGLHPPSQEDWGGWPSESVELLRGYVKEELRRHLSHVFELCDLAMVKCTWSTTGPVTHVSEGCATMWTGLVSVYCHESLVLLLPTVSRCGSVLTRLPGDPVLSRQYRS